MIVCPHLVVSICASLRVFRMAGDHSYEWSCEQLLAENLELLDKLWSTLLKSPEKAEEVLEEHGINVLIAGYTLWLTSNQLSMTRGAVLFQHLLDVSMVSSSFTYYRDCFLFALSVTWDVDVQRFDLTLEQSQTAFSYMDVMRYAMKVSPQRDRPAKSSVHSGAGTCASGDQDQQQWSRRYQPTEVDMHRSDAANEDFNYVVTKENLKALRKRARASRWTQKLCRVVETYLSHISGSSGLRVREEPCDMAMGSGLMDADGGLGIHWDLAMAFWHTILKCDDDAKTLLKKRAKEACRKEKKARKKSKKKASKKDGSGGKGKL